MQFATALIEYLVSGIMATIWLYVLITNYIELPPDFFTKFEKIIEIIFLPVAYILGIYIDATSSFFIRRSKELFLFLKFHFSETCFAFLCKRVWFILCGKPKDNAYKRSAEILAYSPEDLVRTMETYVTRDRIARGVALNSLIGAVVVFNLTSTSYSLEIIIFCLITFTFSICTWFRLRRLSSTFKENALKYLKNINQQP